MASSTPSRFRRKRRSAKEAKRERRGGFGASGVIDTGEHGHVARGQSRQQAVHGFARRIFAGASDEAFLRHEEILSRLQAMYGNPDETATALVLATLPRPRFAHHDEETKLTFGFAPGS
jgi:hypothetical protein